MQDPPNGEASHEHGEHDVCVIADRLTPAAKFGQLMLAKSIAGEDVAVSHTLCWTCCISAGDQLSTSLQDAAFAR